MTTPQVVACVVAVLGCVTDIRSRRIPNVLTFGAAGCALLYHLAASGLAGLGASAAGLAVGLAMFIPFFALGGLGGGDVKLLAAIGAWLGPAATVWAGLYAMLAGGPLAIGVALWRGYARRAATNIYSLLMFWRIAGFQPHPAITLESSSGPRLPYAIPIAAGLALTLWLN
jgi:prepilin peptidase CpaA